MFTFKKYDECQDAGLSLDYIHDDLKNEFYYSVNVSGLDEVIYVVLTDHSVLFCKKSEELSQSEEGEVLASISLTDIKETGHDLLYFANDVKDFFPDMSRSQLEKLKTCLEEFCEIHQYFPFARKLAKDIKSKEGESFFIKLDNDSSKNKKKKSFKNQVEESFLKFCLLEFIAAVDTHEGIFAIYPEFDNLREKLRKSKIYRLIAAKLSYYAYLYKDRDALNDEELTYLVRIYSDLLMDSDFNKIVPPTYYNRSGLLNNPEEELSELIGGNCLFNHKNKVKINHNTEQKIQSFYFTKHSMLNGVIRWRCLYLFLLILMFLWSIVATIAFYKFDKVGNGFENHIVDWFFSNIILWDVIVGLAVVILSILAFVNKSINVFSLRILVTIAIGWLTTFISEDLIKSELEIDPNLVFWALLGILIIIVALIFSEVKQHSPYYNWKFWEWNWKWWRWKNLPTMTYSYFGALIAGVLMRVANNWKFWEWNWKWWRWKILPTMAYSYFWALTAGVLMQFAIYDDLLKHSNALSDIVYKETFEKADTYVMYLEEFRDALTDYVEMNDKVRIAKVPIVDVESQNIIKIDSTEQKHTLRAKSHLPQGFANSMLRSKMEIIKSDYNNLKNYIQKDIYLNNFLFYCNRELFEMDRLVNAEAVSDTVCAKMIDAVKIEIKNVKAFIVDNDNWDTLINWSGCQQRPQMCRILLWGYISYCGYLQDKAKEHNLCRTVSVLWPPKKESQNFFPVEKRRIYPRMLLFHTLLVLVIAFVGQLIVSDKSVTEPL